MLTQLLHPCPYLPCAPLKCTTPFWIMWINLAEISYGMAMTSTKKESALLAGKWYVNPKTKEDWECSISESRIKLFSLSTCISSSIGLIFPGLIWSRMPTMILMQYQFLVTRKDHSGGRIVWNSWIYLNLWPPIKSSLAILLCFGMITGMAMSWKLNSLNYTHLHSRNIFPLRLPKIWKTYMSYFSFLCQLLHTNIFTACQINLAILGITMAMISGFSNGATIFIWPRRFTTSLWDIMTLLTPSNGSGKPAASPDINFSAGWC